MVVNPVPYKFLNPDRHVQVILFVNTCAKWFFRELAKS